jgi:pimeloyl-ACP methyl ester carboxylesterase
VPEQKLHRGRALRRDPDFLRADLAKRMAEAPVRFRLMVTLAGPGDNTSDASVKWPKREQIVLGELELTAPGPSELAGTGELRFDPTRVVAGIELPEGDDLLTLRKHVYSLSARRRIGCPAAGGSPPDANPGAPVAPAPVAQPPAPPARAEPVERPRYAHPHGVKICYETSERRGRPLLLIMGFACSMIWWHRDFRAMLEDRGFHLIRFDNRDSGRSSRDFPKVGWLRGTFGRRNPPYTVDDMAADAAGVLDAAGVKAAHVMGVSLGGMIAQALAINHPQRVLSLTTISATPAWHDFGLRRGPRVRLALKLLRPQPTEPEDRWMESSLKLWRLLNAKHFPFEEEHVRGLLRQAWEWDGGADNMANRRQTMAVRTSADRTEGLRQLRVPTLVIHGSADPLVRVACGYDTWKAVYGAQLTVIDGMGHYTPHPTWSVVVDGVTGLALGAEQRARSRS